MIKAGIKWAANQVISPWKAVGGGLHMAGKGFKTGNLTDPKVIKGLGIASLGLLGTTAIIKASTRSKDKVRQRYDNRRNLYM